MPERSLANVQAVVFAGGNGNRMMNLTEQMAKALLPVANLPLYWYALNLLSRNSVEDVILITNTQCDASVRNALKTDGKLPPLPNLNIEVVCLGAELSSDEEEEDDDDVEEYGTADVLRQIRARIKPKRDLLIVSGDIVSDISLEGMCNFHRANSAFLTCLFWDSPLNGPVPGPRGHHKKHRDFSALVPETGQLLYLCEEEDFDAEEEFDSRLFQVFPKVQFTAKYKDCYIYLLNPIVCELLSHDDERKFASIKADLIPYLLKGQYLKTGRKITEYLDAPTADEDDAAKSGGGGAYRCFAYRATSADCSLLAQCNTTAAYFEANRAVQRILKSICPAAIDAQKSAQDFKAEKANVSESVVAADGTKLGEKSTLKKSVIGPNCRIGEKAKVENSLLISGAVVKEGAVIKSCIVFPNVEIGEKAEVNMCVVGTDQKVSAKEKFANTVIRAEREMNLEE